MRRFRTVAGASLGALALVSMALAVAAPPAASRGSRSAGGATGTNEATGTRQADEATEYVVTFEGSAADAVAAVDAAGGQVVDVNEQLGLALVSSTNRGFMADAEQAKAVTGAARNHAVGATTPGREHRFADERPTHADRGLAAARAESQPQAASQAGADPLTGLQWGMDMIGAPAAHERATGRGVTVGIIDTGVDGRHVDIAPNFDAARSRNFATDIPAIDGPCEVDGCVDPADVDDGGHGTHVAGTVAAARNGVGITGVAPDATIVNVRAGQDSGYFFVYETAAALTYAADARLDVVNMSFYVDPWLFNCDSADDYLEGEVTDDQLAEQTLTRQTLTSALEYAHARGVTVVAAAGNDVTDLAAPTRRDPKSPDYPAGQGAARTVSRDCLNLPAEGPYAITVGSVGPSGTKSDFSNYGLGVIDVAAPGGWFGDRFGGPDFQTPGNLVLSSYPLHVAQADNPSLADANGKPTDAFSIADCDAQGVCGFYTYLQGTSMAAPYVTGLAALIIEAQGHGDGAGGYALSPDTVGRVIAASAADRACPAGGVENYEDEGRGPEWNAACVGTPQANSLWGEGIVDAAAALGVARP